MAKLIFGCGYLGMRVAHRWLDAGHDVYATTRSATRAKEFRALGIHPLVRDLNSTVVLPELPSLDTVLFAVGFDRTSGKTIHDVYVEGLRNALASLPHSFQRFIYTSSTGVYGQSDGQWVDEDSPCEPTRDGGCACLAAERLLEAHPRGPRAIILRLAGLYGPRRIPKWDAVKAGIPLSVEPHGYLNLIHVDDAARIVLAAEANAKPPCRYLVADGEPVARGDFYRELARRLAAPSPQFVNPPPGSSAAERAISSKRVRNARMRHDLDVTLMYPSYREGLAAIAAHIQTCGSNP